MIGKSANCLLMDIAWDPKFAGPDAEYSISSAGPFLWE